MKIRTRRVYGQEADSDGRRILVDRLWPRGVAKATAGIHCWARAVAPSHELRAQLGHGAVTLVFGLKEMRITNATALREYLSTHG